MKLGRIVREGPDGPEPRLVTVVPEGGTGGRPRLGGARPARAEGATREGAARIASALFPASTAAALGGGDAFRRGAELTAGGTGGAGDLPLGEVEWTSPVDPPAMLDASAFEQHP